MSKRLNGLKKQHMMQPTVIDIYQCGKDYKVIYRTPVKVREGHYLQMEEAWESGQRTKRPPRVLQRLIQEATKEQK